MPPLVPWMFLLFAAIVDRTDPSTPTSPPALTPLDRALAAATGESFGATRRSAAADALAAEVLRLDLGEVPDPTLLAVLLAGATGARDPRDVAVAMLTASRGDLGTLSRSDVLEAGALDPIGEARLLVVREISRRAALRQAVADHPVVTGPEVAARLLRSLIGVDDEHFIALFLDNKSRLLRLRRMTTGTQDHAIVDPRQILSEALRLRAAAVMVAHNHPSGDCAFSTDDIRATKTLVAAADVVGVRVVDHLLLTRTAYTSMAAQGLMAKFG